MKDMRENSSFKFLVADDELSVDEVFIDWGVVVDSTNLSGILHSHEFFELEFICDGETVHKVNGNKKSVGKGYAVLLKPNDFHAWYVPKKGITCYTIKFFDRKLSSTVANDLLRCNEIIECCLNDEDTEKFLTLLKLLYAEMHSNDKNDAAVRSLMNLIVISIMRHAFPNKKDNEDFDADALFQKIFAYVERRYLDPNFSLTDVSGYVNRTISYVCQIFKNNVGVSFNKYIKQRRLNYSLLLLNEGNFSISDIAQMSGFNTVSYYISVFRQFYGVTPKQYMENHTLEMKEDEN